ncbi:MAG: SRPBCC domain-containing protein [Actinobacteria bacterium]|nr:MAG: SRPBCC domain-containing protein [Actinomycetota bacterium]
MSRSIETAVTIAASAERVWEILEDFPSYPEWNPFLVSIEGEAAVGGRLRIRFEGADGRRFTFKPRVLVVEEGRRLEWRGVTGVRGVFDGHHRFRITPIDSGHSRLEQAETFTGLMVPVVWRFIGAETRAGFEAMNAALAGRAES